MAAQPSLYEVLGVAPSASAEQIRHAYRAAARRTHPDAGGQPAAFAQVRIAYDVLADPD
ncbi:DnaJ domain-containing protein, partial [Candidatus Frankia nodulisporulans]